MVSGAVPPTIPMAIEQVFVDSRFHSAFFALCPALCIAGLVFAIGKHARNKRNPFSVGRPQLIVRASRKQSEAVGVAAIQRDPINLLLAVARREKRYSAAVR